MNVSSIRANYLVECSVPMDEAGAKAAIAAKPVPTNYWIWKLESKSRKENPLWVDVDVEYQIPNIPGLAPGDDPNPLLRASTLSSSYDESMDAYFQDSDGKFVINSANDRFENFPLRRNGNLLLQITKNFASFPAVAYDQIKFTRNQSAVTIKGTTYAAGTLLFLPATVVEANETHPENNYHFFVTTFRLLADHEKHLHKIDDRGYNEYVNGELKPILATGSATPLTSPWPLNGAGKKKPLPSDAPEIIIFTPYALAEWGIDFS